MTKIGCLFLAFTFHAIFYTHIKQFIRGLFCSELKKIFVEGQNNRMNLPSSWAAVEVYVMSCQRLCESHWRGRSRLCGNSAKPDCPPLIQVRWLNHLSWKKSKNLPLMTFLTFLSLCRPVHVVALAPVVNLLTWRRSKPSAALGASVTHWTAWTVLKSSCCWCAALCEEERK